MVLNPEDHLRFQSQRINQGLKARGPTKGSKSEDQLRSQSKKIKKFSKPEDQPRSLSQRINQGLKARGPTKDSKSEDQSTEVSKQEDQKVLKVRGSTMVSKPKGQPRYQSQKTNLGLKVRGLTKVSKPEDQPRSQSQRNKKDHMKTGEDEG